MAVQMRDGLQKSGVSRDKDRDEVYFGGRIGGLFKCTVTRRYDKAVNKNTYVCA